MANLTGVTYDDAGNATYHYDDGSSTTYAPGGGVVTGRGPTNPGGSSGYIPPTPGPLPPGVPQLPTPKPPALTSNPATRDFSGVPAIPIDSNGLVRLGDGSRIKAKDLEGLPNAVIREFIVHGLASGNKAIEDMNAKAEARARMTPEERFAEDKANGKIPQDAKFIEATSDGGYSYSYGTQQAADENAQVQQDFKSKNHIFSDGTGMPLDQWNKLEPKYQKIADTQGFDAMTNALLDDGYIVNGQRRAPRNIEGGKVENPQAVNLSTSPILAKLSPEEGLKQGIYKYAIDEYGNAVIIDKQGNVQNYKDKTWVDKVMPTLNIPSKLGGPNAVFRPTQAMALGSVTTEGELASNLPSPETVNTVIKAIGITGGTIAGVAAVNKIKNAVTEYQIRNGVTQHPEVAIVNTADGSVTQLSQLPANEVQKAKKPQGFIEVKRQAIPGYSNPANMNVAIPQGSNVVTRVRPGGSTAIAQGNGYLLDPIMPVKDAEDYVLKSQQAQQAAQNLSKVATATLPVNYNKILQDAINAKNKVAIDQAFKTINASIARNKGQTNEDFQAAYQDFGKRQALLAEARRSFVATLNPVPIDGKLIHKEAIYILAGSKIITYIKNHPSLTTRQKTQLIQQVAADTKSAVVTSTATKTHTVTKIQPQTQTKTQTQTATKTAVQTATQTQTQTKTQTATQTAQAVQTATLTNTAENVRPTELTRTQEAENVNEESLRRFKKPDEPKSQKNGDNVVSVKPGSLAFEQGRLKKGEVIKYIEPPYNRVKTLVGEYPAGYRDTGDSPKTTIQTIGGPVKRKVDVRIGVVTAHATPDKKEITFTANPKVSYEKGKIRIVESSEQFKERSKPVNRGNGKYHYRDLGAGIVVDRRGRHLKLY